MDAHAYNFIEKTGLLFERSGGSKTLGRVFGYLLISGQPRTLDEMVEDLLFSKATASLTVRQGLLVQLFEKVSIPGERKNCYQVNIQSFINLMSEKIKSIAEWNSLIDFGLDLSSENKDAIANLMGLRDYLNFLEWYLADIAEAYKRWKKDEFKK